MRFAAVTSEGSADSTYSSNGNLIVADSADDLAELLRQECGEGWLAHGRVWDLDAPWHPEGNLEVGYRVVVGPASPRSVHVVAVGDREGVYVFETWPDSERFLAAVFPQNVAWLTEEIVHDSASTDRLIEAEEKEGR